MDGLLVEVTETTLGSQSVNGPWPVGSTEVEVEDLSDFPTDGGIIDILGIRYAYEPYVPPVVVLDPDGDTPTGGALTLSTPLEVQVDDDDPVLVVVGDEPGSDVTAVIDIPAGDSGDGPDGDVVLVRLDHVQRLAFPIGVYDPPLPIVLSEDQIRIIDAPGVRPVIDGGYIDPGTLPDSGPTEPPVASPVPTVDSGSGAAVVRWTAVDDATAYDIHISTTNATAPNASTLLMADAHSPAWVSKDQNGSALSTTVDMYFAIVARNPIDDAPPSAWVPGRPGPISQQVLSASLALVQNVVAELVETQGLQIGEGSWNSTNGIDIPGVVHFPVDGQTQNASVQAAMFARSLVIDNFFSMRGTINSLEAGARLALDSGVTAPTTPAVITPFWPSQPSIPNVGMEENWTAVGIASNYLVGSSGPFVWCRGEVFDNQTSIGSRLLFYTEGNPTPTIVQSGLVGELVDVAYSKGRWFALVKRIGSTTHDWRVHSWPENNLNARDEEIVAPQGRYTHRPALVALSDGNTSGDPYIQIVGRESDGVYRVRQYQYTSGAFQAPLTLGTLALTTAYDLGGAADGGTGPLIIFPATANARAFNDSGGVGTQFPEVAADGFPRASGRTVAGVCYPHFSKVAEWGQTAFVSVEPDGTMHRYSNTRWNHKMVYTWYDSVGTTHETTPSPETPITAAFRSSIRITVPNVPAAGGAESPDQARIYVGTAAITPRLQGHVVEGFPEIEFMAVDTSIVTTPPTTNGFENTASDPAELAAVTGGFYIDGNSGGDVGTGGFRDSVVAAVDDSPELGWYHSNAVTSVPNGAASPYTLVTGWAAVTGYSDHPAFTAPGSGGAPSSTIKILKPGLYQLNTTVSFDNNTTGRRVVFIFVNGAEVRRQDVGSGGRATVEVTHTQRLDVNDEVAIRVYQNSGAALALGAPGHDWQVRKVAN